MPKITHQDFVMSLLKSAREQGIAMIAIYSGQEDGKLYTRLSANASREASEPMLAMLRGHHDVEAGARALHARRADGASSCAVCNHVGHGMDSDRPYAELSKAAQRDHVAAVEAVLAAVLAVA